MLAKEIKHQIGVLNLKSIAKNRGSGIALGYARTSIPAGQVMAKYIRDEDYSIITAVVKVESDAEDYTIEAEVRVTIHYAGDMMQSTQGVRDEVVYRIEFLAQKACAEHIENKFAKIK